MTPEAKPLTDTQRMWDLVRHQRSELFNADLITDDEYAALAEDHPAVGRLESYDELRAAHAETRERERKTADERDMELNHRIEAEEQLAETRERLEYWAGTCKEAQRFRDNNADALEFAEKELVTVRQIAKELAEALERAHGSTPVPYCGDCEVLAKARAAGLIQEAK